MDNKTAAFTLPSKLNIRFNKGFIALFFVLYIFIFYNVYVSFRQLAADKNFITAYGLSSGKQYKASFDYYSSAVELWEGNSFFHYEYGGALLDYAVSETALDMNLKISFLEIAKSELLIALNNYPSKNTCNGLISIVCFELGDTTEAEKIKNEILERDSLMVNYRFALAHLYIEQGKYEKALNHLLFNCKYDPGDNRLLRNIYILLNDKNCPDPIGYCNKILAVDPKNEAAILFLKTHR